MNGLSAEIVGNIAMIIIRVKVIFYFCMDGQPFVIFFTLLSQESLLVGIQNPPVGLNPESATRNSEYSSQNPLGIHQ